MKGSKNMTLKELHNTKYQKVGLIGIFDPNNPTKPIYPDYADELIETHGDKEVTDHMYSTKKDVLVVALKD